MGHPVGDALLRGGGGSASRRRFAQTTCAARLGGDEFAVVLWDREDLAGARRAADRLLAAIDEPFILDGSVVSIHASIGIAGGSATRVTADELMRNADVAMYVAKANGKGRVVTFETDMATALTNRTQMTADLRRAIVEDRSSSITDPCSTLRVDTSSGPRRSSAGTIRSRGLIEPLEFIPLAEQSNLIVDLGLWVLEAAIAQMAAWDRLGEPLASWWMSVNVAPRQLEHPGLVDDVRRLLEAGGTAPERLALEVTESGLITNPEEASDKLKDLKGLGVRLMIDDFGTGYSSLGYLQRFPVGVLKIAREFVDVDADQAGAWGLAAAIIAMARTLDLDVIAEGVEDDAQLRRLRDLGCRYAQGFLLARPMPAGDLAMRFAGATPAPR